MKKFILVTILALLPACSNARQSDAMKTQLDAIRVMIKQSALMAVNAACADGKARKILIHAAAVQDRRGMGGPEMAKIHKMMNMQPDNSGGKSMKKSDDGNMSAEMAMHVALHDAGEDVFDFLDGIGETPGISCQQAAPVSLAASAAMLREAGADGANGEPSAAATKLDAHATAALSDSNLPDTVKALTLALQKI